MFFVSTRQSYNYIFICSCSMVEARIAV